MFYCSKYAKIRGIEGKEHVIRNTDYKPGKYTLLLRAAVCEKSKPPKPLFQRESHKPYIAPEKKKRG